MTDSPRRRMPNLQTDSDLSVEQMVKLGSESPRQKPRMTAKVLHGLVAMAAAIEAGDMMGGDLEPDADEVRAALAWIWKCEARACEGTWSAE